MRDKLLIEGMQGMGDNLHQRALIRQLLHPDRDIWLRTSWPCIYEDFPDLTLLKSTTTLRTQVKNIRREISRYGNRPMPSGARVLRPHYSPDMVRTEGSVLGAMLKSCGCDPKQADFRLPVLASWRESAARFAIPSDRPLLIYRPLVKRTEWTGCDRRNPDAAAYAYLFGAIRDHFFVVSIADLMPDVEWIVSHPIEADVILHAGELDFQSMAGLFSMASLVFCSPGFSMVLAQAIGTPLVTIFGGWESSPSISIGARYSPTLGIDPINPCSCFRQDHNCDKTIDLPAARNKLERFIDDHVADHQSRSDSNRRDRLTEAFFESKRT